MSSNALIILLIIAAALAIIWFAWPRNRIEPSKPAAQIEPSAQTITPPVAPKAAAAEPVAAKPATLMDTEKAAAPKAKAPAKVATKAPAKTKAAPAKTAATKPKAEPVKKAATPKAKAEPTKKPAAKPKLAAPKAAAPKAKPAAPTAKAAPVAKPKATPVAKPKAAPKPKPAVKPAIPDNLELLKGVGPKLNTLLKTLGVTSFEQVANWTGADIAEIDAKLGTFAGRISRDNWVDQAKLLLAGDVAGFEKKYGALGSEVQKG